MFKSSLQEYVQKSALLPPVYASVREGPSHAPRFTATVTVDGICYTSGRGFGTLKAAEKAAARVALETIARSGGDGSAAVSASLRESGLCKNLLQEYAQKSGLALPVYRSISSGESCSSSFTSTVELDGVSYTGASARSRKEAEISAARTALSALRTGTAGDVRAQGSSQAQPVLMTTSPPSKGTKRYGQGAPPDGREGKRPNTQVAHIRQPGYEASSQESCLTQLVGSS